MSPSPHKRVQVCIRVRPPPTSSVSPSAPPSSSPPTNSSSSVVLNDHDHTISVLTNQSTGTGMCFHFDHVLSPQTSQAKVYEISSSAIVASVLKGYNGTILAYGQTGAGKTFTMSGGKTNFDQRGICARAISSIFQQISRDSNNDTFVVRVSYVEVYNENLYDLLTFQDSTTTVSSTTFGGGSSSITIPKEELVIQENDRGQTFVKGLSRPIVKTEEDALDLLFQGDTNRTIAEHCLNASSTRSHCIFTVYVERSSFSFSTGEEDGEGFGSSSSSSTTTTSKLHLVDLAGSERMKKTHVTGVMQKEASHINKSLTFLEQVVLALGDKKRTHIPYRQTPLTNLLKDSLGGNCHTMLVACVWPEVSHTDQTLATLKFATRMMRVKTSAVVNMGGAGGAGGGGSSSGPPSKELQAKMGQYVAEIKRLKEELAMHDTLNGNSLVEYDLKILKSETARKKYKTQLFGFIQDPDLMPPIENVTQIKELLAVFRELYVAQEATITGERTVQPPAVPTGLESRLVAQLRAIRSSGSSACTKTNTTTLPVLGGYKTKVLESETHESEDNDNDDGRLLPPLRPQSSSTPRGRLRKPPLPPRLLGDEPPNNQQQQKPSVVIRSDKELFDAFKSLQDPKPESLLDLEVAKQNLRIAKAQMASFGMEINKLKLAIDGLTVKLQDLRTTSATIMTSNDDPSPAVDDEEEDPSTTFLVLQLKNTKKQYREAFEKFQEKKAEVNYLLKIKEQMLQRVTYEFHTWKNSATTADITT